MKETTIKLLQREDQSFDQDHFDFDFLRREGLKHIGALSGKIWTDHNMHDPGITILEMLAYALMDLGYRTQLPIQDILATPEGASNSYFTPAQILSNNPTTILDYRKLLIAIDGVQNAWLFPNLEENFYLNCDESIKENHCDPKKEPCKCLDEKFKIDCHPKNREGKFEYLPHEFTLNGLYSICIQKEPNLSEKEEIALKEKVLDKLNQHRNLCEDFVEVKILCEETIGICADVEINDNYDPEEAYVKIIIAIEQFFSPNINFYTLQEMLEEKGKLIEEVFEGRPYDPNYNSPGFIDVDELEKIPLRKEIHLSDLYGLLSKVEGVASVRNIILNGNTSAGKHQSANDEHCREWVFHLATDHVPVFSPEASCINLSKDGTTFQLDAFEIQRLKSQHLKTRTSGRARGNKSYLDIEIPNGNYRPDLGEYYSIQNEFPRVYGIGEGGLPDTASKKRQAQALQLKGYLLFFDQLLVNYLAQLSNARHLFSFENAISEISQIGALDSVPDLDSILQYYNTEQQQPVTFLPLGKDDFFNSVKAGLEIKNPIEFNFNGEKFSTHNKLSRDIQIEQLARELDQENYSIKVYPTENCYYFVIQPDSLQVVLLARAIFESEEEAKIAGNNMSYVGTKKENYQPIDRPSDQKYSFELLFSPVTNTSLVEELTSTEQSKLDKRNHFLDHLLARFSESFADYSLLAFDQFQNKAKASGELIKAKTNFLSIYPDISGNRGKAFNYRDKKALWNSKNISGVEKRLFGLSGLENWEKKYLCNFEVHKYEQEFQVEIKYRGKTLFKTKNVYESEAKANEVCKTIIEEAKNNEFYVKKDLKDCFLIEFNSSKNLEPLTFKTESERDLFLYAIRNLFHETPVHDNTNIYAYHSVYRQELHSHSGEVIAKSKDAYETEAKAVAKEKYFVDKIKDQTPVAPGTDLSKLKLMSKSVEGRRISIERSFLNSTVKVADSEYRWQVLDIDGEPILTGCRYSKDQSDAFEDYLKTVFYYEKEWRFTGHCVQLVSNSGKVLAEQEVTSEAAAELIMEQADQLLDPETVGQSYLKETGTAYGFEVRDPANNRLLLESVVLYENRNLIENLVEAFQWNAYQIIKVNETRSTIQFKDQKGNLIASTREAVNDPQNFLNQIISNADKMKVVEFNNTYTFKILNNKGTEELLEGFSRYHNQEKAYRSLFNFLEAYKKGELSFKPIGQMEAELANIELFIIDKKGQFQAFSPKENFRKPEYWKKEKKVVNKTLKDLEIPLDYTSESKFYLADLEQRELLRSTEYYSNPNSARNAGRSAVFAISQIENIAKSIICKTGQDGFVLNLEPEDMMLAITHQEEQSEIEESLEGFQSDISHHTYFVSVNAEPDKWKYQFYWIDYQGKARVLYHSKKTFGSPEKATQAYLKFLNTVNQLNFEAIDSPGKFGFRITSNGQVLEHPKRYKTPTERDAVISQVVNMFETFRSTHIQHDCVYLTERSKDDESYVYRVFKKGNPIAFHPCECFDLEDEVEKTDFKNRLEELCEQQYDFAEFYLRGNKILCRKNGRYHYVLKDKKTNKEYFISKESYYSKKEAIEAFQKTYLNIIHLASDPGNYQKEDFKNIPESCQKEEFKEDPTIYYLGKSYDNALVTMTEDIFSDAGSLASIFCTFPIRIYAERLGEKCFEDKLNCYYFHLVGDNPDCKTDWLSTDCYETPEEAWKDFEHFLNLLKNKNNFRPHLKPYLNDWRKEESGEIQIVKRQPGTSDFVLHPGNVPTENKPEDCCYYISVTEVLAESCVEYLNESSAWGKDQVLATYVSNAFQTSAEACEALKGFEIEKISKIETKARPSATINKLYFYEVKVFLNGQKDETTFVGEQLFESQPAANAVGEKLFDHGNYNARLKVIMDDDCLFRIAIVETFDEPSKVDLPCQDETNACTTSLEKTKGLERFLQVACSDEAFVPCLEEGKSIEFSFKVVDPSTYWMARHPYKFHTREDRNKMISWIYSQLKGQGWSLETVKKNNGKFALQLCMPINKDVTDEEYIYYTNAGPEFNPFNLYWEIDDSGEGEKFCLLEIAQQFTEEEIEDNNFGKILSCFERNIKYLLTNQEYLVPTGDFSNEGYGIALINPNCILATHPQSYICEEDMWKAIEETKAHIHTEGMHLLEHILLRPEEKEAVAGQANEDKCACTLLATPDFDCQLTLPSEDLDPCLTPGEMAEEEESPKYTPGADPYSFLATVVFPCWSKRYKDANFRTFVTNTLLRETPSHIAINQLWLGPQQLCAFENKFRQWLHYKANTTVCDSSMPCDLIQYLMELKSCCSSTAQSGNQGCDCEEDVPRIDFRMVSMNSLFNNARNYQNPILTNRLRYLPIAGNQVIFNVNTIKNILSNSFKVGNIGISPGRTISVRPFEIPAVKTGDSKTKASAVSTKKEKEKKPTEESKQTPRAFSAKIADVEDANVLRSKTYEHISALAENISTKKVTKSTINELDKVVNYTLRYAIGRKGGGDDKAYTELLANTLALTLDKLVAQNKVKVFHKQELRKIFTTLEEKGVDLSSIKKTWNVKGLKAKHKDASAIDQYLKLFDG